MHSFNLGLPVAFCMLPNKRSSTYTELFERLKDHASVMGKQFNPQRIVTDYEPGLLPVIQQEVSLSTLTICIQHTCNLVLSFHFPYTLDVCFISIRRFIEKSPN